MGRSINLSGDPIIMHCSQETGSCGKYFSLKCSYELAVKIAKMADWENVK